MGMQSYCWRLAGTADGVPLHDSRAEDPTGNRAGLRYEAAMPGLLM